MKYTTNILAVLAVIVVFMGTVQTQPNHLPYQFENNDEAMTHTSARNSSCDPSFNISLDPHTYTPNRKIPLEVSLSCMDYQSVYDDDGNGVMDFDLRVTLHENGAAGEEQVWFANQNSKNCVGFSCVYNSEVEKLIRKLIITKTFQFLQKNAQDLDPHSHVAIA